MKKILIVEDERLIGKILARQLESSGYTVCDVISSGEEAVAFADREALDAIIMDIILIGELDGFEAAKIIRKRHHVPIVFLTCFSDDELSRQVTTIEGAWVVDKFDNLHQIHQIIKTIVA